MGNSREREWPVEPAACEWAMPDPTTADENGVAGIGADLAPSTLLAAYRNGLFPMPLGGQRHPGPMGWWSPDPRGIVPLDGLRVSRSLRRSCARYEVRVDTAFEAVIDACAEANRPGGWITREIRDAYVELHRLGWAHSVEAWVISETSAGPPESTLAAASRSSPVFGSNNLRYAGDRFQKAGGRLVGGLYGVAIGGLFAGESMFHSATDASKVALVALVELLRGDDNDGSGRLLDVQWATDHLATLGAVDIPRVAYLERLDRALPLPLPTALLGTRPRA